MAYAFEVARCFAQRRFCARLIFLRAVADIFRRFDFGATVYFCRGTLGLTAEPNSSRGNAFVSSVDSAFSSR